MKLNILRFSLILFMFDLHICLIEKLFSYWSEKNVQSNTKSHGLFPKVKPWRERNGQEEAGVGSKGTCE